jgi:hypothetical protein
MLSSVRAELIINEVRAAMSNARSVARRCGISDSEMERFFLL